MPVNLRGKLVFRVALMLIAAAGFTNVQAQSDADSAKKMPQVITVNPEDLLDFNKTVLVPTAFVTVAAEGRVSAVQQSGLFQRGNATARSSVVFKVQGLDKSFLQELAQVAQNDFIAKLQAAGYTVLTYNDVKDRDFIKAAERDSAAGPLGLPSSSEAGITFVTAAPSDEQHFKSALAGGAFAAFIKFGKSLVPDATVIVPHYTLQAPQIWGETSRGYNSVSAEVKQQPGMNLVRATAYWLGAPKSRMMRGIPGVATKQQVIDIAQNVGTITQNTDTTPQVANAVGTVLSMLSGAGNIQRSSQEVIFQVERDAFSKGALAGIAAFNVEVAKAAAEAKP